MPSTPRTDRPVVRPETEADRVAVADVVAAAFGAEPIAPLLQELRTSRSWVDLSLVAVLDEAVVGHVSLTRGWVDAPTRLVDVLVLSPLSVRPERQRRGVGSALVRAAQSAAADRGELVFLEGDPRYYSRLGFRPAGPLGFTRPSPRIPEAAFQVWSGTPYPSDVRGQLVYPDAFWRHDAVGLRR